jgi:broad specificity phosphatase PhoE/predicted kinase
MRAKLYVAMVGLPARGKSTMAKRIREGLREDGIQAAIFNNGNMRRELFGSESTKAAFYDPANLKSYAAREYICRKNFEAAREYLACGGDVAILDATNARPSRRAMLEASLTDHPVLFIECVNEDPVLVETCIRRKANLPEYAGYSAGEAYESFNARIRYYESMYCPLSVERYWMRVDTTANRILDEHPCEDSPYYSAIRDILVTMWVRRLFLARHGQTVYNIEGRIGGNPALTEKGQEQAAALAKHLRDKTIAWVFTSTRLRSLQTAAPLLAARVGTTHMALKEFDEINAGDCEEMSYEDIRRTMPQVTLQRNADKYHYVYPHGESYAILRERVRRGLRRALFLAGDAPLMIVGHQAINRVILSLFLLRRSEDIPYTFVPQNQYYHICTLPRRKVFELVHYTA